MLPVSAEQAEGVRTLPAALRRHDPFDRLLVAQARALGLTLLTADRVLLGLDLPFVVDATR
nr:PIN domain-containing protein [Actinomycetospora sp. NBRC 106378]